MKAIEETYFDVEKMLCQLSWKYARLWGIDYNELRSVANVAFMDAYKSWNAERASFITHLYYSVTYRLTDFRTQHVRHVARFKSGLRKISNPQEEVGFESVPDRVPHPIVELLSQISDDAKTIVQLVADLPEDLAFIARLKKRGKAKRELWRYIKNHWGWSLPRTMAAFTEIQELITLTD